MTEQTETSRELVIDGTHWRWRQLSEDTGSLLCLEPIMKDGVDHTDWPTDAELSSALGFPVRFVDGGDHPDYPEGIYSLTDAP